jgi:hypothetical protein
MKKVFKCYELAACEAACMIGCSAEMALMEKTVKTKGDAVDGCCNVLKCRWICN